LLVGGIGDVLAPVAFDPENGFWGRFFFDFSFYCIIVVILLNVVFGIILDTCKLFTNQVHNFLSWRIERSAPSF
jgi:hypothetical protein